MDRLTIQDMQQRAIDLGGKCLSKEYWGQDHDLTWRCERGHIFDMRPRFIQRGAWCPQCTIHDKKIAALELMQEWAEKYGGKCLSKKYINSWTPLLWECKNGHRFKKSRDRFKQKKSRCNECEKIEFRKQKHKEINIIAKKRLGKCLSDTYINMRTKLEFECMHGHRWKTTPRIIMIDQSWCPDCYGIKKRTIDEMHKLAANKKGKCLSKKYINIMTPLKWQCEKGHVWATPPNNIISGTWCPKCHEILIKTTDIIQKWTRGIT